MHTLLFSEKFEKSFSKKGNPYWSIHVNRFRVIYELKGSRILIADILQRKNDYGELQ